MFYLVLIVIVIILNIRIVPKEKNYVIERLNSYYTIWEKGIHVKIPFVDRIYKKVSLKEINKKIINQQVITKDNFTIQMDIDIYFEIVDTKNYAYQLEESSNEIESLVIKNLRSIISELELEQILMYKDIFINRLRSVMDEQIDSKGLKVNKVEVNKIISSNETMQSVIDNYLNKNKS